MGMEQLVVGMDERTLIWPQLCGLLRDRNLEIQLRMIDGELALPEEVPPSDWRELRVSTGSSMITISRVHGRIRLTIWGNASEAMQREWNALTLACAELTSGEVLVGEEKLPPAAYRSKMPLPE